MQCGVVSIHKPQEAAGILAQCCLEQDENGLVRCEVLAQRGFQLLDTSSAGTLPQESEVEPMDLRDNAIVLASDRHKVLEIALQLVVLLAQQGDLALHERDRRTRRRVRQTQPEQEARMALEEIRVLREILGDIRLCRCIGGVNMLLDEEFTLNMKNSGFLSPDNRCKAFDDTADGYVRAEGGGLVLLANKSLATKYYAEAKGSAINQKNCAGNKISVIACQERTCAGNLIRRRRVSQRHTFRQHFKSVLLDCF